MVHLIWFFTAMAVSFAGSALASVTGFGNGLVLLPVIVFAVGPKAAIPILTIAQLFSNLGRVGFNWGQLDWRLAGWFALGGVPGGAIGSLLLREISVPLLERLLGGLLLAFVGYRQLPKRPALKLPRPAFAALGAAVGVASGLVGTAGPLMAPFFLEVGLSGGAFVGTEALAATAMHIGKSASYIPLGLLGGPGLLDGVAFGIISIGGAFVGKKIVDRVPQHVFGRIIEGALVLIGLYYVLGPT